MSYPCSFKFVFNFYLNYTKSFQNCDPKVLSKYFKVSNAFINSKHIFIVELSFKFQLNLVKILYCKCYNPSLIFSFSSAAIIPKFSRILFSYEFFCSLSNIFFNLIILYIYSLEIQFISPLIACWYFAIKLLI